MDNSILSKIKTTLYVVYIIEDGVCMYYKGSTFYNTSEWSDDITDAFFFNHEPRPFELTEILENANWNNIGIKDILIKPLLVEVTETDES